MSFYRLKAWFEYRRHAIGRHGLHSPAIYQLMDKSLRGRKTKFQLPEFRNDENISWKGNSLLVRIAAHFRIEKIVVWNEKGNGVFHLIEKSGPNSDSSQFNTIWIFESSDKLIQKFDSIKNQIDEKLLIAVQEIHADSQSENAWEAVLKQPDVRISLDFFRWGILIFSDEFREKQRFVLKYPV